MYFLECFDVCMCVLNLELNVAHVGAAISKSFRLPVFVNIVSDALQFLQHLRFNEILK